MTKMQVFYGRGGGGDDVVISDICVEGTLLGDVKATGGVWFGSGGGTSWVEFAANGNFLDAKGMTSVRHVDALGVESFWMGEVTSVPSHSDKQVYFGEIIKAEAVYEGRTLFLLEVTDNGEGKNAAPDEIRTRTFDDEADMASRLTSSPVFTFSVPIEGGNIQVH